MTRVSENRISHLAHLIVEALRKENLANFRSDRHALAETKQALTEFFEGDEQTIDEIVNQKIRSLSRHVPPGSREWDVLYRKYYEEESRKRRSK